MKEGASRRIAWRPGLNENRTQNRIKPGAERDSQYTKKFTPHNYIPAEERSREMKVINYKLYDLLSVTFQRVLGFFFKRRCWGSPPPPPEVIMSCCFAKETSLISAQTPPPTMWFILWYFSPGYWPITPTTGSTHPSSTKENSCYCAHQGTDLKHIKSASPGSPCPLGFKCNISRPHTHITRRYFAVLIERCCRELQMGPQFSHQNETSKSRHRNNTLQWWMLKTSQQFR